MRVTSLGFRTDLALRVLEGAEVIDRGDYLVIRSPDNPAYWWGTSSCSAGYPNPAPAARGWPGWPRRWAPPVMTAEELGRLPRHARHGEDAAPRPVPDEPEPSGEGIEPT